MKIVDSTTNGHSHENHHIKPNSISDEEGHISRHNPYAEINNLDAIATTEKLAGFNKPKPVSAKRPPSSTIRKYVRVFQKQNI